MSNQLNIFEEKHKAKCKAYRDWFYRGVKERFAEKEKQRRKKDLSPISIRIKPNK